MIELAIASVPGVSILHVTSDWDHNRTVITFAGTEHAVAEAAFQSAAAAARAIDLNRHQGVHPRLGALDVLPFVPLGSTTLADCVALAHQVGERIWHELAVPVYFYEAAALHTDRVRLENVRRGQFEGLREAVLTDPERHPDLGDTALHPTAGAVIVGARKILVAFNINLATTDVSIAKDIARQIRASSGGLPAVKALGLSLESKELVQVSMNLTDLDQTPLYVVYDAVSRMSAERGVVIAESELIGLLPRRTLELAAARYLQLTEFESSRVIEDQIHQTLRVRL